VWRSAATGVAMPVQRSMSPAQMFCVLMTVSLWKSPCAVSHPE
jgi:hypothetical protein